MLLSRIYQERSFWKWKNEVAIKKKIAVRSCAVFAVRSRLLQSVPVCCCPVLFVVVRSCLLSVPVRLSAAGCPALRSWSWSCQLVVRPLWSCLGTSRLGDWCVPTWSPHVLVLWTLCIYFRVQRACWLIPNLGPTAGNNLIFFVCVYNLNMPIYESKRAVVGTIPALALTPAPTLAGILDDLEQQIGVDIMKTHIVNIMQHSAKSFVLHLATVDQVEAFMARGLTFRGHLLEFVPAKNTSTIILDRVPYGLPEASIHNALARYGELKSLRPVTNKGYGLSKFKLEMVLKQDIASRIMIQGNAINVFYKNQPRSCFVCAGAGHEAKNCPRRTANKRAAPADPATATTASKIPRTFAAAVEIAPVIHPPTEHDPPTGDVPLSVAVLTRNVPSDPLTDSFPPGTQLPRGPPPEPDPPQNATVVTNSSDTPTDLAVDPPASDLPVEHTSISTDLTESPLATATRVENETAPSMDTTDQSTHSMDTFPNLDKYFEDSPTTTNLRPRPDPRPTSSASQSPSFRTKRSGGIQKKTKPSPASQTTLAAGARNRTTPQAVTGSRRRSLQSNQFRVLTDDLDDPGDQDNLS